MIQAGDFVEWACSLGIGLWTGVPCSYLQPFINHIIGDSDLVYVPASNEGDAVAIAAGYQVGGGLAVAMLQNSGLGNAVNPLTSLAHTHRIPLLLIVTLRGESGGVPDEPQHELMGSITASMLELMEVPWEYFPQTVEEIEPCLRRAQRWMLDEGRPYCLLMRKDSVAPCAAPAPRLRQAVAQLGEMDVLPTQPSLTRRDCLQRLQEMLEPDQVVLTTTGYTGRELYALADREQQLYLVGGMGCVSSVGLGLALARPDLRIVVLDGDGALLMRMGALTTIAHIAPPNLLHVLLDNGLHESTGGQATVSRSVHLAAVARACGYPKGIVVNDLNEFARLVSEPARTLRFVRLPLAPGVADQLPRPQVTPVAVTQRLRDYIGRREIVL